MNNGNQAPYVLCLFEHWDTQAQLCPVSKDGPQLKSQRTILDLTHYPWLSSINSMMLRMLKYHPKVITGLNEMLYIRPFMHLKHTENFQLIRPVCDLRASHPHWVSVLSNSKFSLQTAYRDQREVVISISSASLILPALTLTVITLFICKRHCQSLGGNLELN